MAVDEAISLAFSEGKEPPTLRLYAWSIPTFSIGSFQHLEAGWRRYFEDKSLMLVRRITGGRALLHDSEIAYSVVASTQNPLFLSGIKGTFFALAGGLLEALDCLGVKAQVYTPERKARVRRQRDPLCFSSTSWYEVVAEGKKLIGSAQKRWANHFLQQGSLMLQKSQLCLADQQTMQPFLSDHQISLSALLPVLPSDDGIVEAFKSGFESALGIRLIPGTLSPYEKQIMQRLIRTKYGQRAWNFDREVLD